MFISRLGKGMKFEVMDIQSCLKFGVGKILKSLMLAKTAFISGLFDK